MRQTPPPVVFYCAKQILAISYLVPCNPWVLRTLPHSTIKHTTAVWNSLLVSPHLQTSAPLVCHPSLTALSRSHHRAVTYEGRLLNDVDIFFEGGEGEQLQYNFIFPSGRDLFCVVKRKSKLGVKAGISRADSILCTIDLLLKGMEWLYSVIISLWGDRTVILWC